MQSKVQPIENLAFLMISATFEILLLRIMSNVIKKNFKKSKIRKRKNIITTTTTNFKTESFGFQDFHYTVPDFGLAQSPKNWVLPSRVISRDCTVNQKNGPKFEKPNRTETIKIFKNQTQTKVINRSYLWDPYFTAFTFKTDVKIFFIQFLWLSGWWQKSKSTKFI